ITPRTQQPDPLLRVDDHEYHLAALMYKSIDHFRSITIIQGCYLWYDGLASVKTCWIAADEIPEKMKGFQITEAWYLKQHILPLSPTSSDQDRSASLPAPPPPPVQPQPQPEPKSKSQSQSQSRSASKTAPTPELKPKRKQVSIKKTYPYGFSVHPVKRSGLEPICRGCNFAIDRGENRL
ncbi:hypothetical protein BGW39_003481, partial [Mortierella sp. 14UC]